MLIESHDFGEPEDDIHLDMAYAKLYDDEAHRATCIRFKTDYGTIRYLFSKRPIPDSDYFDIATPYGYGGPTIVHCESGRIPELIAAFSEKFASYCHKERIITEFIRFHPLLRNAGEFQAYCHLEYNRETISITLKKGANLLADLPGKCRNMVRKAILLGVTVREIHEEAAWQSFYSLYKAEMTRLMAPDFYHFSEELFVENQRTLGSKKVGLFGAFLDGKMIAGAIVLRGHFFTHYHLAASSPEGRRTAATNLVIFTIASNEAEGGKKLLHLGGGRTAHPDDSLLHFKQSFSKTGRHRFYTGKVIHDDRAYRALCEKRGLSDIKGVRATYFPEYRSP